MTNSVQALRTAFWNLIKIPHYQWAIAVFVLVLGGAALWDGPKFFKYMILSIVAAFTFFLMMSQLEETWVTGIGRYLKFFFAIEVGLFVMVAAWVGWQGTQLLLGGAIGMYMFDYVTAVAVRVPYVEIAAKHSLWTVIVSTLCVGFGCWMIHDHQGYGGADKVLGLVAPAVGSTLVASAFGYLFMLLCTVPSVGKLLKVVVLPSQVPSVLEFWWMIVHPLDSQAVGFFAATHRNLVIGKKEFPIDRILGILFAALLFAGGAYRQWKNANRRKAERQNPKADGAADPLLGGYGQAVP